MGKRKTKSLSPKAERFIFLMHKIAGGSQRHFAGLLSCSQAVISKIANGEQEPGPHILRMVKGLRGVNIGWFETGVGEPFLNDSPHAGSGTVSISRRLFAGPIMRKSGNLTGTAIAVPSGYATGSIYGIAAGHCEAVEALKRELICDTDILLVESDPTAWQFDVDVLDKRLVVAQIAKEKKPQLCRVAAFGSNEGDRLEVIWPSFSSQSTEGKAKNDAPLRDVQANKSECHEAVEGAEGKGTAELSAPTGILTIPIDSVVGLVLQLVRSF